MNLKKSFIFSLIYIWIFFGGGIFSQSEEYEYAQELLIKSIQDKGYGDKEFDELHQHISALLPGLKEIVQEDKNGDKMIELEIAQGESILVTGQRYVFSGKVRFYVSDDFALTRVVLIHDRFNAVGGVFLVERRELNNGTPAFPKDDIDPNDDVFINYYESVNSNGFELKAEVKFKDIEKHYHRKELLDTYKQYLRKSEKALILKVRSMKSSKAARVKYIVDFK